MTMRRFEILAGSALAFVVACGDSEQTGGAGSGGAPVTAGNGGGGAGAGAGGTASDGGSGGAAPAACQLPAEGCDASQKCSIVDTALGIPAGLGCVDAGDGVAFSACDADEACAAGLFCDYSTAVCKPFCDLAGFSCVGDAACVTGRDSAGLPIQGLNLCVANCDPQAVAVNPCGDDDGATCYFREDVQELDCGANDNLDWGSGCTSSRQCQPGLGCFANTTGTSQATMCLDWCGGVGAPNACYGSSGDGDFFCIGFEPCGPCAATGYDGPTGVSLGSCSWGE